MHSIELRRVPYFHNMSRKLNLFALLVITACSSSENDAETTENIFEWQRFDNVVFEQAESEDKLVLLDIGANWCHWCHVMDEKTYADPTVQEYLSAHFVLAREDQDSRPDLYAAYRNWGWPAIIVFNSDKQEVLKLKGYQEKTKFLELLGQAVKNPQPITEETTTPSVLSSSQQELYDRFISRIDHEKGMYHQNHKFLQLPGVEHGLKYYRKDDSIRKWLDVTIENSYELVDPVWSGVYQYSTQKAWTNQHYEKLLRVQANYIEAYARYGMVAKNEKAIQAAEDIFKYCERFLGNETPLYYNSQNADVIPGKESKEYYAKTEEERLKIGTPSVDENSYLKENAMLAKSLIYLWAASNDEKYLNRATHMTDYIVNGHFKNHKGVFNRNVDDGQNMFSFEDNRELLELFMIIYQATGNEQYLYHAENSGVGMDLEFGTENGMVSSAQTEIGNVIVPLNNLDAAINYNYLGHLTKDEKLKKQFLRQSEEIFAHLDQKGLARVTAYLPVVLRAKQEFEKEPFHAVLITDGTDNELPKDFYPIILANPDQYVIFEHLIIADFTEEQELLYGGVAPGTLFMCTSSYCSAPIKSKIGLQEFFENN